MPTTPVRELLLEDDGGGWHWGLAAVALALGIGLAVAVWNSFAPGEIPAEAPVQPVQAEAPPVEVQPVSQMVQVVTDPPRGRVYLGDIDYGISPTAIPLPPADELNRICISWQDDGELDCRRVRPEEMGERFVVREFVE